jgi:hypothetical protein
VTDRTAGRITRSRGITFRLARWQGCASGAKQRRTSVKNRMHWLAATVLLGATPWAAASCYLVYAPSSEIVYRSVQPPFDVSVPYSKGLQARFPNHQVVVVNDESNCVDLGTGREPEQQQAARTLEITSMLQPRSADAASTVANDAAMRAAGKSTAAGRAAKGK